MLSDEHDLRDRERQRETERVEREIVYDITILKITVILKFLKPWMIYNSYSTRFMQSAQLRHPGAS